MTIPKTTKGNPAYDALRAAIHRCSNPGSKLYHRYGARGIRVYEPWIKDWRQFAEYIGPRPTPSHSLDRIDNDGNYEPGNVRWATDCEQNRNKGNNRRIAYQDVSLPVSEWAAHVWIPVHVVFSRIDRYGWSVERALTTPVAARSKRPPERQRHKLAPLPDRMSRVIASRGGEATIHEIAKALYTRLESWSGRGLPGCYSPLLVAANKPPFVVSRIGPVRLWTVHLQGSDQ